MKKNKIVIAGGTGFIGQELCNFFGIDNEIVILTREGSREGRNDFGENQVRQEVIHHIRYVKWDGINPGDWTKEVDGCQLVINLAGKSVNCRYTKKNKQAIFDSRVNSTKAIGLAIQQAIHPPQLWINAASATIYPDASKTPYDESNTVFHDDFSVAVCKLWEKTFYEQQTTGTRKVCLRMAITLGRGGVMVPYFNLLKFKLGGRQGSGRQMYSWVHITDTCRMIDWIEAHKDLEGNFNCSSPGPVNNVTFMSTLRELTGHRIGLPAYKWMLTVGAMLIGTETELILKSRWVLPARILTTGFEFKYPTISKAMEEIISTTPRNRYQLL